LELPVIWIDGVLQYVPLSGGYNSGFATGISDDGTVVVGQMNQDGNVFNGRAFSSTMGMTTVYSDIAAGLRSSTANGVSGDGRVIVGWTNGVSTSYNGLRIEDGVQSELFDLPGGVDNDAACNTANFDGSVIGGRGVSVQAGPARYEACLWSPGPSPLPMGDLSGGRFLSGIQKSNSDGTIVVGYANSGLVTKTSAFGEAAMWHQTDPPVSLGDLPGGDYSSYAFALTDDGSLVFGYGTTEEGQEAFVWSSTKGMERLVDALESEWGSFIPTGWTLTRVLDVSPDGTTIVGRGSNPDEAVQAWQINVPCWVSESIVSVTGDVLGESGGDANFGVTSEGSKCPNYQWQISVDGSKWNDLIDGVVPDLGTVSGANSNELSITGLVPSMTWYLQVEASNSCGSDFSETMLLVVDNSCPPDLTGEGDLNFLDVSAFLSAFANQDPVADFESDGNFNFLDVSAFLSAFAGGCP
jgi:uncharacterized membrane protein